MKNMTKQGGATYGPDGQSSTLPCRAWGLTPEARDCKVIIVAQLENADANTNANYNSNANACMDGHQGVSQKTLCRKMKCTPHHVASEYLVRSYLEGETQQTSLGGPY